MIGHLFIFHGDLKQLSCDAWLMPRDPKKTAGDYWPAGLPLPLQLEFPEHWGQPGGPRTFPWTGWTFDDGPQPWLTNIGASEGTPATHYLEAVEEFLQGATAAAQSRQPLRGNRDVPLLALPVVGTGKGGASTVKGAMADALVRTLLKWVAAHRVDVALVCFSHRDFAACQQVRAHHFKWSQNHNLVDDLAGHAQRGQLSLFIGAGASMGAGLPSWEGLLRKLCRRAGTDFEEIKHLPGLDQALLLSKRLDNFKAAVKEETDGHYYSLTHGLLAGLGVRESITQNYDRLIERAWAAVDGSEPSVLPTDPKPQSRRWVLKMHGCVSKPETIVLTREDYLRYDDQNKALAGLVQGSMLTRHLLFCGFSLKDDNFISIVDVVRKARPGNSPGVGTVLMANAPNYLQDLWGQELRIVSLPSHRDLEILLDQLLATSQTSASYLLDPAYAQLLSKPGEKELAEMLMRLADASSDVRKLAAWEKVEALLGELGYERKKPR